MAAVPSRSSTPAAGANLSSQRPGHVVIVVVPASSKRVTVDIPAAAAAKKPKRGRSPAPVVISAPPAKHVTVDIRATTAAAKKPARASSSRPPRAEHVAVDIPAAPATTNKQEAAARPRSPLVRALVQAVSVASLFLGVPAMVVAATVTHRLFPFGHIACILALVFICGLVFLLVETEKDKQLQQAQVKD